MTSHRLLKLFAIAPLAVLLAAPPAAAHGYKRKGVEIVHPWSTPSPEATGGEGVVGMTLRAGGKAGDRLLGAATPLADKVEFCQQPADAGAPPQRVDRIEIKPGTPMELKPAALHLRLVGLKKRLAAYDSFPMTLTFEKAGKMEIEVMVEDTDPASQHTH